MATTKATTTGIKPVKELMTSKTALIAHLATASSVDAKSVKAVFAALEDVICASLGKKGAGGFVLPGLMKITVDKVPAKKARKGIDPFTKQERVFAAKPATTKVKLRALKKIKDAANS